MLGPNEPFFDIFTLPMPAEAARLEHSTLGKWSEWSTAVLPSLTFKVIAFLLLVAVIVTSFYYYLEGQWR
jgi:hypothetical protein